MSRYVPTYGNPLRHYEYKSFDADKFIGGFYTDNMEHPLLAVIAHEVAHAIQFGCGGIAAPLKTSRSRI